MTSTTAPTRAADLRSTAPTRHGAYVCLRLGTAHERTAARAAGPAVAALVDRLRLTSEFEPGDDHPAEAFALLRRVAATAGAIPDDGLAGADAVVHVASAAASTVAAFTAELAAVLAPMDVRILGGVVRPTVYTGNAMHDFAYAHRVLQQPGGAMPNAFLLPMSKTADWWQKDWMERHTYFLPRHDGDGRMQSRGHVLSAEPGIACLMRRTYKSSVEPAPPGGYDFVNYFECADADVPVFHAVCAALRDAAQNPEWRFVREGPTWHGRRVATWDELLA